MASAVTTTCVVGRAARSLARWIVPEYRTHVLENAKRRLRSLLTGLSSAADTRAQIAAGPVITAITEVARARQADLIVVGRSRRFRPLGSTAARLARNTKRELLVVPVSEAASGPDAPKQHRRAA